MTVAPRPGSGVSSARLAVASSPLALASPAHAADEITIDHVETADGTVSMVLVGRRRPERQPSTRRRSCVEVDGRAVDASAKTVAAGDIERSTVLVLDASNSMAKGGKFDAATAAVDAFLDAAPDDVRDRPRHLRRRR